MRKPVAANRGRNPLALAIIAAGAASALGYLVVGAHAQRILYGGWELVAVAGVWVGVARFRPTATLGWSLLGVGLLANFLGDILHDVWGVTGVAPELAYFCGYAICTGGLMLLLWGATGGSGLDDVLDTLIVAVGVGVLVEVAVVEPLLGDARGALPWLTSLYPVVGVASLVAVARLAVARSWRVPSLHLLLAALAVRLGAILFFSLPGLQNSSREGGWPDTLVILVSACFAAAANHPSMRELPTRGAGTVVKELPTARLVLIGVLAVSMPMVVGGSHALRGETEIASTMFVGVLEALVVLRLVGLLQWRVRAEALLGTRLQQQAVVASLGRHALEGADLHDLTATAAHAAAELHAEDDEDFVGSLAAVVDAATARAATESRLKHQVHFDRLTDLPNWTLLTERLEDAAERSRRGGSRTLRSEVVEAADPSPCCWSTSTTSRSAPRASATTRATSCSEQSPRGWWRSSASATPWLVSAATSSPSSAKACPARETP